MKDLQNKKKNKACPVDTDIFGPIHTKADFLGCNNYDSDYIDLNQLDLNYELPASKTKEAAENIKEKIKILLV